MQVIFFETPPFLTVVQFLARTHVLARTHKKFQRGQHSEIYLLTLKEQDKTKMELPLGMVSKHAFWYLYLPDYMASWRRRIQLFILAILTMTVWKNF